MSEQEVQTEVPGALKRLARYIVRGFYGPEHAVIIDMLVRNPCVKEDDLMELLKLERKQLRASLNTLKMDRFIKSRMKIETAEDGKNSKHNYYFINYKIFVNVVKYKLDHMRRKIELEERDNTSRASFKCPSCEKTFTDLEADQLYDPMTGSFCCTFCRTEVEEDESAMPKRDARMMLAKFNEQIQPLCDLLRECEGVTLAPWILEPEPTDMRPLLHRSKGGGSKPPDGSTWSGDSSRNRGFGTTENTVTVTVKADGDLSPSKDVNAPKAVPDWIKKSTVSGVPMEQEKAVESTLEPSTSSSWGDTGKQETRDDIMRTLLVHERKAAAVKIPGAGGSDDESSTSESDQERPLSMPTLSTSATVAEMESEDDDDSTPMISVGGVKIALGEVTDEITAKMTPAEKEEYIRLSKEMYEDMYL